MKTLYLITLLTTSIAFFATMEAIQLGNTNLIQLGMFETVSFLLISLFFRNAYLKRRKFHA